MAQLTDLEKIRRIRVRRKRLRSLLLLILFVAVVFAVSMVVYHKGEMDIKTAVNDLTAEISTGTGYPVQVPGGKLLRMLPMDNTLVIVADSNLYTYNNTGRRLLDVQHGMVNPTVTMAGGRMLAYDRGATKVMLFSRSDQLKQITADFPIYDGDLAQNGNFALASSSDKHLSRVIVYNGEGNQLYRYFFGDRLATCVSLADARDAMVIGLVDVRGGEFLSTINRYQFSLTKPSASLELPGELLLALNYEDGGVVRAITDQRAVTFNSDLKETASFPFGDLQLLRFQYDAKGRLLLHLREVTGERRSRIQLLDERLNGLCAFEAQGELSEMKLDSDLICLSTKSEIFLYDLTGRETARFSVGNLGLVQPMNGMIYYTTASELCAKETTEIKETHAPNALPADGESQPEEKDRWAIVREALLGESGSSESGSPDSGDSESGAPEDASSPEAPAESAVESGAAESELDRKSVV